MSALPPIFVDHTHCGRNVTGLERITLELFSREALAPIEVTLLRSSGVKDMVWRQTFVMPCLLARHPKALLVCPGFPPSPLATAFGGRVLPYIHDTFLITRPADLNARAKLYMAPSFRLALRVLPRFLVNSETTRDEVRRLCRGDAEIVLYRPAVRNVFGLSAEARDFSGMGRPLRLIALGTMEPRKNLAAAAKIISALRARGFTDACLDIVGREGWGEDVARLKSWPGVVLHGYQPVERVRELMQAADILISTSHDEGLGLPLLEAQYAGLAVVAPDKPVFREVLGDSGLLIDASDAAGAAEKIAGLVNAPGWRAHSAQSAAANLARWLELAAGDAGNVRALIGGLQAEC